MTEYRSVFLAAALVVAGWVAARAASVLLVLFAGVLFAVFLHAVAHALARWTRTPYGAWVAGLLILVIAGWVVGAIAVAPRLADELSRLAVELPRAFQTALDALRRQPGAAKLVPQGGIEAPEAKGFALGAAHAIQGTVEVAGALVVILFVGGYGAAQPSRYVDAVAALAPEPHRGRVRAALVEVNAVLTRWLIGRAAAMVFVGVASGIVFLILGVPLALALAVLAGALTFVEYIGAIASAIPAILLAFTKSPLTALWVTVAFTGLHVVEGYILTPLFARASARFPPACTLAGQVVLAALVGPLGLTLSTPLLIVVVTAARCWARASRPAPPPQG